MTHDSVYKGPHQNDTDIKRQLSKCMALMETTDDMFCRIFDKISLISDADDSEFKKLLAKATQLFNLIVGSNADYKKSDLYFLDAVLYLYQKYPISRELLEHYAHDHKHDIRLAIEGANSSLLAKEPASLILFCYLEHFESVVTNYWPLSMDIVDGMRESLGLSAGSF